MRYKLLALDIDGTLTNSNKIITTRTRNILIQLQKQGVKIALASGRPTYGVLPLAKELKLDVYGGYILSFNGGYVQDVGSQKVIYQDLLDENAPGILYPLAKDNNCNILSYEEDSIITETPDDPYVLKEAFITKMKVKQIDSFTGYIDFPIPKCLIVQEEGHLAGVEKIIASALGERFNVFRSEPYFLEIMPKSIDKAYSLSMLAGHLNLEPKDIMACGDSYNDLSMLKYAGLGVAMKNARDIVKQAADYITLSNDEDGIAHAIESLGLLTPLSI